MALKALVDGKPQSFQWTVAAGDVESGLCVSRPLVESAKADGGLRLVTVGTPGLKETRRIMDEDGANAGKTQQSGRHHRQPGNRRTVGRRGTAPRSDRSTATSVKKQLAKLREGDKPAAETKTADEEIEIKKFTARASRAAPTKAEAVKYRKPATPDAAEPSRSDQQRPGPNCWQNRTAAAD